MVDSFSEPIEFSKVLVPLIIHNFANPTINQSFLSITVIFTCEEDNEFLNSLAAESPPKPPPKMTTTWGIFVNLAFLCSRSYQNLINIRREDGDSTAYNIAFAMSSGL